MNPPSVGKGGSVASITASLETSHPDFWILNHYPLDTSAAPCAPAHPIDSDGLCRLHFALNPCVRGRLPADAGVYSDATLNIGLGLPQQTAAHAVPLSVVINLRARVVCDP